MILSDMNIIHLMKQNYSLIKLLNILILKLELLVISKFNNVNNEVSLKTHTRTLLLKTFN